MGLFTPQSREGQAFYICCENARFQEILRGNKRKIGTLTNPDFWSECKERSDGIASLRASKTSRAESEVEGKRTCVALHRRIVVARRSTGSLLQLLALGGFAAVKTVINCFYLATLPPQADGYVIFSPLLLFLAICTWWLKKSGQYGTINI